MTEEKLLTFGGMLKLKREQKDLTLSDVIRQTNIFDISKFEKGVAVPSKKTMAKIVAFYKITEDDLQSCRTPERGNGSNFNNSSKTQIPSGSRISVILESLNEIIRDVTQMPQNGFLATKLRLDALDNLDKAQILLQDSVIIERLI